MSAALEYADGWWWLGRGLQPHLKSLVVPEAFYAWTSVGEDLAPRLESGGDPGRPLRFPVSDEAVASRPSLPDVVCSAMHGEAPVWLVPDAMAKPSDGFLDGESDYVAAGDAVYYATARPDPGRICEVWRRGSSAAGQVGLVCARPVLSDQGEELEAVVRHTKIVVMSAFDGEGVLFFERRLPGDPVTEDLAEILWFAYRPELGSDYISLSELERYVGEQTAEDDAPRVELTLAVIKVALDSGDAEAGAYPQGADGLREVWSEPANAILARTREQWTQLNRAPRVGEILWLQNARRARRRNLR